MIRLSLQKTAEFKSTKLLKAAGAIAATKNSMTVEKNGLTTYSVGCCLEGYLGEVLSLDKNH